MNAAAAKPRFLLDTDICIYVLAGEPEPVRARAEAFSPGDIGISAIALAEFMVGARRLDLVTEAERLIASLAVLSFDDAAARAYAQLPFRRGRFDRLIAGHALSADLILVTNNEKDYADIAGLRLENWTRP